MTPPAAVVEKKKKKKTKRPIAVAVAAHDTSSATEAVARKRLKTKTKDESHMVDVSTRPKCPGAYAPPTRYLNGKILCSHSKWCWRVFPDWKSVKETAVAWGSKNPEENVLSIKWDIACETMERLSKR